MATKADLRPNEWIVKFIAGGEVVVDVWVGNSAMEAANAFLETVTAEPWWPFHTNSKGVLMVRTSFIGAIEVYR